MSPSTTSYDAQRARYDAAGQGHVFHFWDRLSAEQQEQLLAQTAAIDIARASLVFKNSTSAVDHSHDDDAIRPLPEDATDSAIGEGSSKNVEEWRELGLKAISESKVGVLLMAGGQGTRLGSSDPKGCYDIGLPSHKPLFALHAERIIRLQAIAEQKLNKPKGSVVIPWYIMTSGPTRPATEAFFKKHSCFGLDPANVVFFEQGTLPCFTFDGKVIMSSPSEIATAPDGNGGLYAALRQPLSPSTPHHSVLSDLKDRNVSFIHAYGVDNCLVRVADPIFIGYSIAKQADCATKVVPKASPEESVGVVALKGNVFSVVEYSEITKEQAHAVDEHGQLAFRAANIVNHIYTRDFLEQVEEYEKCLAFHIAKKKIPFIDIPSTPPPSSKPANGHANGHANGNGHSNGYANGNGHSAPAAPEPLPTLTKPSSPNGIKLECFVFDIFPFAKRMVVLEVERREEFSPLKNAPGTGSDDPDTSRRDLLAQSRRYLEAAGATLQGGEDVLVEVSPLVTYAGEGLESVKGKTFSRSGYAASVESLAALM